MGVQRLYAQKRARKKDGVALFWKCAELELVEHQVVCLDEPVGDESGASATSCRRVWVKLVL